VRRTSRSAPLPGTYSVEIPRPGASCGTSGEKRALAAEQV